MRHPVSTLKFSCGEFCGAGVLIGVVCVSRLPCLPEHADPGTSEDAYGMWMFTSALSGAAVDCAGPVGCMARVIGEAGDGESQVLVACPSEDDASAFAGGVGDGADAGLGGELVFGWEAFANVAQLGEDLGGADASGAWERHDDLAVGQLGDGVLDARREPGDFVDEAFEHSDQCTDEFSLGVGLGIAGQAGRCGAQPGEQFGRRTAAGK